MKTSKSRNNVTNLYYNNGDYLGYIKGVSGSWRLYLNDSLVSEVFKTQKAAYEYGIKQ